MPRLARIGIDSREKLGRHRWVVERSVAHDLGISDQTIYTWRRQDRRITAGFIQAGAVGAVLAVPVIAILNAAIRSLVLEDGDTATVDPTEPHEAQVPATSSSQAGGQDEDR